jgi:hypothetical protein
VDWALAVYLAEVASMRRQGQLSQLPAAERDCIFALGFALQQLQQNLFQLAQCVADWARTPGWTGKALDIATRLGVRAAPHAVTVR